MLPAIVSTKHDVVCVPPSDGVAHLFPSAQKVMVGGQELVVIPHGITETVMLRRLDYDVPSPILKHYDWCGGTPFDVQKKTCAMLTMHDRAYVLNGMGTGKTKAALWAWHYLRSNNLAKRMLVVAPLSTLWFTWGREIFTTLPGVKYHVLHGTRQKRKQRLDDKTVDIYIINHDGVKVIYEDLLERDDIDTVVLDELAVYRNGGSARSKLMAKLAETKRIVWGMTGSPMPNEPPDVWAQARIITPDRVPKYFRHYRDMLMQRITQFKYVPKPGAVERAFDTLQPAVRFTLDDVLELPEVVERDVEVELGLLQWKTYKAIAEKCHAAVQHQTVTAVNAGVIMNKLLQIATGWVYSESKSVIELGAEGRLRAMQDIIEASDRKILVFAPFKHTLAGISKFLTDGGIEHVVVSGDTPSSERAQIFNVFQNTDKNKVLVAHPQCLAHGITLTAADTVIWFAPTTSLEIYDQANHRIRRVGQKHKQQVIHLWGTKVEKRIYGLLKQKQNIQNELLEMFELATTENIDVHR